MQIQPVFAAYYPASTDPDGTKKAGRLVLAPLGQSNTDLYTVFNQDIARMIATAAGGFLKEPHTATNGATFFRGRTPVDVHDLVIDGDNVVVGLSKAEAHVSGVSLDDLVEA